MVSPCPPGWTFAGRAAYFGDRLCAFCDHRNPAGARFCNECAAPLDLKPCKQCDAVNDQAATRCYKCGAPCPALLTTPATDTFAVPAAASKGGATRSDMGVVAPVPQRLSAVSALRASWRLLGPGQLVTAVIATILIVGGYDALRMKVATHDEMKVASQPSTPSTDPTPATSPARLAAESKPVEPEKTAALQIPIPAQNAQAPERESAPAQERESATSRERETGPALEPESAPPPEPESVSAPERENAGAPERENVGERPVAVPATKRSSGHQRPVPVSAAGRASAHPHATPERQVPAGARRQVDLAATRGGARVAQARKSLRADRWQVMRVSLARCGGDLFARMACDQRVRRHFCEGHWGEAPACVGGLALAIERGQ